MEKKAWWMRLFSRIKQVITPVTVGATAMTTAVVVAYLPVLQADAAEVREAIVKPNTETNPGLHALAGLAHQVFFVEALLICEILLIGTIFILLIKFAFYIVRLVAREYRRTRREVLGRTPSCTRGAGSEPKEVSQPDERAKAQGQQRLEAPVEKKVYLIPGPTKVQDVRKPAEVKDGKVK